MKLSARSFQASVDGAEEEESPTRPVEIGVPAARDRGVLVETTGVFAGRPHPIPLEGATIGRSIDCTVRVDHESLSRVHARVVRLGQDYLLEDMGSLNGCFVADHRVSRVALRDGDRLRLGASIDLRFNLVCDEEERALVRLYETGLRDPLTGLANRKQLDETLRSELSFARRHGTDLALIMSDVDRFKAVNDTYGHLVGDTVLRHVAQVFSATVRTEDVVARFGGEEFVVVARGTSLRGGQQLAERLRRALESGLLTVRGDSLVVTASFGVSSLTSTPDPTHAALLTSADGRMYEAKAMGRNRVV